MTPYFRTNNDNLQVETERSQPAITDETKEMIQKAVEEAVKAKLDQIKVDQDEMKTLSLKL